MVTGLPACRACPTLHCTSQDLPAVSSWRLARRVDQSRVCQQVLEVLAGRGQQAWAPHRVGVGQPTLAEAEEAEAVLSWQARAGAV